MKSAPARGRGPQFAVPILFQPGVRTRATLRGDRHAGFPAGKTQITDRSLELLGRMQSLEVLEFWQCAGLTNTGVAHLAPLPQLRKVVLDGLPGVTPAALKLFPAGVRVEYTG